ncbi:MAG: tetraacyldisaccharide 4'-kinase [Gallionella sp.]|nr:tetraacyldisaccharide 4'-kinase [Gallionella sp.]
MSSFEDNWYRVSPSHLILYPLSLIFCLLVSLRRRLYRLGVLSSTRLPVPVIVVGNITVGGTGKTPLTLYLAQQLLAAGWHPAIISRGYVPGQSESPIRAVTPQDAPGLVGDEPLMMARRELCPVWVGRDRPAVALALLQVHPECDVILSDDGLQHYRLQRDVEIAVIDGIRRFGNGWLLPAGPLREPRSRLQSADAVIVNGGNCQADEFAMQLHGRVFYQLNDPTKCRSADDFKGLRLHAIAGIGNPQRYFGQLRSLGLDCTEHAFADHHAYVAQDIAFDACDAILMTEKDAVKCARFADARCWVLRVEAQLPPRLFNLILEKITRHGR